MNRWAFSTILLSSFLYQYFYLERCKLHIELLNNSVLLLSIFFGFYVVGLSIFSTSKFVGKLYLKEDLNPKAKTRVTLLHTLLKKYKFGLVLNLFSIFYFLVLIFIATQNINEKIMLSSVFTYLFIPLMLLNFIYGYLSLEQLIKIVLQEAKRNS